MTASLPDVVLLVVLICLAVYRVTRLLVADAFPPIAAGREWVERRFGEGSSIAYLVNCPWCTSVYVAVAVVAAVDLGTEHPVPVPGLLVAVASAVAGLIAAVEPE